MLRIRLKLEGLVPTGPGGFLGSLRGETAGPFENIDTSMAHFCVGRSTMAKRAGPEFLSSYVFVLCFFGAALTRPQPPKERNGKASPFG